MAASQQGGSSDLRSCQLNCGTACNKLTCRFLRLRVRSQASADRLELASSQPRGSIPPIAVRPMRQYPSLQVPTAGVQELETDRPRSVVTKNVHIRCRARPCKRHCWLTLTGNSEEQNHQGRHAESAHPTSGSCGWLL